MSHFDTTYYIEPLSNDVRIDLDITNSSFNNIDSLLKYINNKVNHYFGQKIELFVIFIDNKYIKPDTLYLVYRTRTFTIKLFYRDKFGKDNLLYTFLIIDSKARIIKLI